MARWFYITSKRLHRRRFITPGRPIENGTLFPFFAREGEIRSFLLVDPDSPELFLVREAEAISVPIWGPIRIRSWPELVDEDTIEELAPFWHFDPWWLLREARYEDSKWAGILQRGNAVAEWKDSIKTLLYSGNLQRVRWVTIKSSAGDELKPFSSDRLPEYNEPSALGASAKKPGWQLAPFWESASKKLL